jgi:hypothetical protein
MNMDYTVRSDQASERLMRAIPALSGGRSDIIGGSKASDVHAQPDLSGLLDT